ncbi:MAG: DNA polymerase ligase N-terminal domain-containing protein [Acidimicrobiales bacterium]
MTDPGPPLERYHAKRDFARTPEPSGAEPSEAPEGAPRFTVQQHDATRLHWDLRLERDGVLASWALPRCLPLRPDDNHLAVHTEDHPIEYLSFEGDIPEGEYGAGHMFVWDTGWYQTEKWEPKKAVVVLHGERARGRYALFETRGRDWIIHRMDPPEDPTREPVPTDLRPMLATPGPAPEDDAWAWEVGWSGLRTIIAASTGAVDLFDADGRTVSQAFPEVRRIGRALGSVEVVLDSLLVPTNGDRASIDRRLAAASESAVRRLARDQPAAAVLFDVLWFDGHPILEAPWTDRREQLEDLKLDGPAWRTPSAHPGDGQALLAAARLQGLDGLIAKRLDSPYRPGEASPDWVEVTP